METLAQDLRYVARTFARNPGFFLVAIVTLALGLGATTAIFSVVNGVLLEPLPYPSSGQIVQIFQVNKKGERNSVTEPNFADWKAQARGVSAMVMTSWTNSLTVKGLSEPVTAKAVFVSRDFIDVFRLPPAIGRAFSEEERRAKQPTAVLVSDGFWRRNLGASPAALGRAITLGSDQVTIVGVMPPAMDYPAGTDLWMPHEPDAARSRTSGGWRAVARMKDGVTLEQVRSDMSVLSRRLKQQYGDETGMSDAETVSLHEQLVGTTRPTLLVLLAAAGFLLIIACANVVNLLVARMTVRRAEIGLRLALGASRGRLARQCLTESGVLSFCAGLVGVAVAIAGVRFLLTLQTGSLPRSAEVHVSWPVLLFALGVSVVTALALGLLTAWQGTRGDIRETISASQRTQAGSGSAANVRRTLVVSQMALTVVLLAGASLLGRSFLRVLQINPGYRTEHAVILDANVPYEDGDDAARRRVALYDELMTRLRAIPGVTKVGAVSGFPLVGGGSDGSFLIMTRPDEPLRMEDYPILMKDPARSGTANFLVVDGDYFDAMNIPLLSGRSFASGDAPSSAHVALVSASLAKAKWPDESAIGKFIQYGNMDGDLRPFRIVGVVGDVHDQSLAAEPTPTFYAYQPQRIHSTRDLHIVMRTPGDPGPVMTAARGIVRQLRPDVPAQLRTVESIVATSVADRRFILVLVGVFGAAALVLATLGVYSVISYLVTQRRQEIGVRIALGAQRADVLGLVLRQGASLALVGIGVGVAIALALTRLIKGFVFGVSTTDPVAFGGVVVLLTTVALLASWLPARRAARVDPTNVLRS